MRGSYGWGKLLKLCAFSPPPQCCPRQLFSPFSDGNWKVLSLCDLLILNPFAICLAKRTYHFSCSAIIIFTTTPCTSTLFSVYMILPSLIPVPLCDGREPFPSIAAKHSASERSGSRRPPPMCRRCFSAVLPLRLQPSCRNLTPCRIIGVFPPPVPYFSDTQHPIRSWKMTLES